jgi:carboxyl-terminal processing protease
VQNPDWARLTSRGTANLEIALREHVFEDSHVRATRSAEIETFLCELRRQLSQHPVYSLSDARTAVWNAAQLGQLYLHLHAAAVMLEYTAAMVSGLDEYSSFLPAGALDDLRGQLEGDYIGLGLELKSADGALLIVDVIHDSPAERSGIKSGDKILSVNGRSISEVDVQRAIELLTGPEGTTIQLSVATKDNTLRQFMLQREHLDVSSVANVKLVDPSSGIGCLKVKSFQKTTGHDVDLALWQLSGQGMRSLIIDLRGNPGGLLTAAVEVTQKFVASGTIVSTRGRGVGEGRDYRADGGGQWRMPLIVLIDSNTASAAEIMSGALRDYRRATIVGVRSYGKGSVQTVFPLAISGVGVEFTTAQFYSPLGTAFSHVGVEPDVWVKEPAQPVEGTGADTVIRDDEVLVAALQVARSQLFH